MGTRKPDFIIIGAAKAGTTSLYRHLTWHPSIFMSDPKEPTYFAFDERYGRGEDWYQSLFSGAGEAQLCGEASTNYTNWPLYPHTVKRMHALLPDVKLIYVMRHPVDRAYSHYIQLINNIRNDDPDYTFTDTFEQHIAKDDSVIQSSNYMLQINRFLEYYPRERFLFLFFEDFIQDPGLTLERVISFLGIDKKVDLLARGAVSENLNKEKEAWLIRSRLTGPLRTLPGAQWIADRLPQGIRDSIYAMLRKLPAHRRIEAEFIPPRMQTETRVRLLDYFLGPNRELGEFLGQDLSRWNE